MMSIRGEGCKQPTAAMPTIRGMSTLLVTLTTTMPGIVIGLSRLLGTRGNETCLSAGVSDVIQQGAFALLRRGENTDASYTSEPISVAEGNEGLLFDNLFDSMLKRRRSVRWKPQVKAWTVDGVYRIYRLTESIAHGTYRSSKPTPIKVTYPKERTVFSIPFRDRIFQGYLNDKYIYPCMTRSFVYANSSCQYRKGTDFARGLLKKYLWRHYTHYRREGYVLQIDIRHYYQTISKTKALEHFKRYLTPNVYRHVEEMLAAQYDDGFCAGSQLIQILGISFLDRLDHFIKESLCIKGYIRYQDDFIIIHPDKTYLVHCLEEIKKKLAGLGLEVHPHKTHIKPVSGPIDFLGFRYSLDEDGKIYMRVLPKKVKEIRRRLRKHPASLDAYIAYIGKGDSYKLIQRLKEEFVDGDKDKR